MIWKYWGTFIWEMLIKDYLPVLSLIIQGKNFEGLVDTGADVSVISSQQWPQDWKKRKKPSNVDRTGLYYRCLEEHPSLTMPIP